MFSFLLNRRKSKQVGSRLPLFARGMQIMYHGPQVKWESDLVSLLSNPEPSDDEVALVARLMPMHFAGRHTVVNQTTVALTATTAKTTVGALAATNVAIVVSEIGCSFDGATSTNTPALVEICSNTFATNPPGTNSTSVTPTKMDGGYPETIQFTAARNWTTEPTVITVGETKYVGQFNGVYHIIKPDRKPWIGRGAQGWSVRITSPNNVNCAGHMSVEE